MSAGGGGPFLRQGKLRPPLQPGARHVPLLLGLMMLMLALKSHRVAAPFRAAYAGLKPGATRFALAATMLLVLLWAACGGGGNGGGGGNTGTPAGTYNLTLTATAGGVSKTSTLTLTVN